MMTDTRPICTAENPRHEMDRKRGFQSQHPDTRLLNNPGTNDHGDEHHECPHCGLRWWREGPDY